MQQVLLLHLWLSCIFNASHPSLICFKDPPELGLFSQQNSSSFFRHCGVLKVEFKRPYKCWSFWTHTILYTHMAFILCPQPPWSNRNFKAALQEAWSCLSSQVSGRTQPAAARGRDGNTAPSVGQQKSKCRSVPKYFPSGISLAIRWGKFAWLCSGLPFTADHQLLLKNHSGYSKIETLKEQQVITQY